MSAEPQVNSDAGRDKRVAVDSHHDFRRAAKPHLFGDVDGLTKLSLPEVKRLIRSARELPVADR
jgi:hypothetical protein